MPAYVPPHKEVPDDPGPEVRLELCELAAAGDERLDVSRLEIDRGGPSFTVDTLRELHARHPEHELIFIVGGDMAVSLPTWKDPLTVLELARLAIAERSGALRRDITERLTAEYGEDVTERWTSTCPEWTSPLRDPPPCGRGPGDPLPRPRRGRPEPRRPGRALRPCGEHRRMSELRPDQLVAVATELADDKKAIDIVELAVSEAVGYTDYFLICSGNTERQVKAIHDGIHQGLKDEHRLLPRRVEGLAESRWVLMDYLDVVVHIFTPEARDFYRLEQLWGEVPARAVGTA